MHRAITALCLCVALAKAGQAQPASTPRAAVLAGGNPTLFGLVEGAEESPEIPRLEPPDPNRPSEPDPTPVWRLVIWGGGLAVLLVAAILTVVAWVRLKGRRHGVSKA